MREVEFILGVDPGSQGGIAVISKDHQTVFVEKLSDKTIDALAAFFSFVNLLGHCEAYMESVNSMPGEGVSSAHSFGKSVGRLEMGLAAHGIPAQKVQPQVWQRKVALGMVKPQPCYVGRCKGKTCSDRKHAHKRKADLILDCRNKVTLETCDALLIAEYGWRTRFI